MELVLGLATLATAISGVANAGHYGNAEEYAKAEPTAVQKAETIHQQEFYGINDIPETRFEGIENDAKSRISDVVVRPRLDAISEVRLEVEGNNTPNLADEIDDFNGMYNIYTSTGPSDHSSSISGKIGSADDVDWYKFTLYGKARVTLKVDRPSDHDFCVTEISKKVEQIECWKATTLKTQTIYSQGTSNNFSINLYPGIYYVKVGSPENGFCSNNYTLNVQVNYTKKNESMVDLADKGAKAALWLCDYDPFGFQPKLGFEPVQIGNKVHITYGLPWLGNETVERMSDPAFPLTTDRVYKQAELFVWDLDFRQSLRDFVRDLRSEVMDYFADHADSEELSMDIQRAQSGLSFLITLYGLKYKLFEYIGTGYGLSSDLTNILFPSGAVYNNKAELLQYLEGIFQALAYNGDTGTQEVVRIPIGYRVRKGVHRWVYQDLETDEIWPYTFEYCPCIQDDYLYERSTHQNTIYAHDFQNTNPINGTIYPIVYTRDIEAGFKRNNKYDLTCMELPLNYSTSLTLDAGESKWYKFKASHRGRYRIRSTGDSNAAVHVSTKLTFLSHPNDDPIFDSEYRTPGYDIGFSYDFVLNAGETLYFRVCGTKYDYTRLYNTTIKITEIPFDSTVHFEGSNLPLASTYDNMPRFNFINNINGLVGIGTWGTYSSGDGLIEMQADRDGICPKAAFTLYFNRPVKTISLGYCIPDGYSYACLGLYVFAHGQYGQILGTDILGSYSDHYYVHNDNHWLYKWGLQYATPERDLGEDVYAITFSLDPDTDQSPYHVSYQRAWIGDIDVEYAD